MTRRLGKAESFYEKLDARAAACLKRYVLEVLDLRADFLERATHHDNLAKKCREAAGRLDESLSHLREMTSTGRLVRRTGWDAEVTHAAPE